MLKVAFINALKCIVFCIGNLDIIKSVINGKNSLRDVLNRNINRIIDSINVRDVADNSKICQDILFIIL